MNEQSPRPNYQRQLEQTLEAIARSGRTPKLLLHSCCAPCSSYVLEYLSAFFEITVLYYNPNLYPAEEFDLRAREQARLIREMDFPHPVQLLGVEHQPEAFWAVARGFETQPEGGERCTQCFRLRLARAAQEARARGMDYFTTTLSISPHKDAGRLATIGAELAQRYQVPYLFSDFKKRGGYQRSIELSRRYALYRQDYCGCLFSQQEAEARARRLHP